MTTHFESGSGGIGGIGGRLACLILAKLGENWIKGLFSDKSVNRNVSDDVVMVSLNRGSSLHIQSYQV